MSIFGSFLMKQFCEKKNFNLIEYEDGAAQAISLVPHICNRAWTLEEKVRLIIVAIKGNRVIKSA